MAELRVESLGDGLWRWSCETCGRKQIRPGFTDAVRTGLAHEHIPAPATKETPVNKWSRRFWTDLAERVGTTAIYGVIAMLTADQSGIIAGTVEQWWAVVGLPTALALLKGLAANMAAPDSGASLVPNPPGPEVVEDERGESALYLLVVVLVIIVIAWFLVGLAR